MRGTVQFINDRSEQMLSAFATGPYADISDALAATEGKTVVHAATKAAYAPIRVGQGIVSYISWMSAFEGEMQANGGNEQQAAQVADRAVNETQGGNRAYDIPSGFRSPLMRLATTLMGYQISVFNQLKRGFSGHNADNRLMSAAGTTALALLIPAIGYQLLKAGLKGDDPKRDQESWAKFVASRIIADTTAMIPLVNAVGKTIDNVPAGSIIERPFVALGRTVNSLLTKIDDPTHNFDYKALYSMGQALPGGYSVFFNNQLLKTVSAYDRVLAEHEYYQRLLFGAAPASKR
jgi:hypothetical protein